MDEEKRFTLRMDASLFRKVANLAAKHKRSTAKEIEHAVEWYIRQLQAKEG